LIELFAPLSHNQPIAVFDNPPVIVVCFFGFTVVLLSVASSLQVAIMVIVKNEPVFAASSEDYSKPRHIIVKGSNEEIGFDLGTLAKNEYGVELGKYKDPIYGVARREYLARNWPSMLERSKGVLRAFGFPEDDNVHDATQLPFDFYDYNEGGQLDFNTCSAAVLPIEKSNGGTFVSRNFDLMAMYLWSDLQGKKAPEGAHMAWSRAVVVELRPDNGYSSILVGGQELLSPYIDGINEKGLYVSLFHDPAAVGDEAGVASGKCISGVSMLQSVSLIMDTCATVEEAKKHILANRFIQTVLTAHAIIADAAGNSTVFEITGKSQEYVFTDREKGEPQFITNHPISTYPELSSFPKVDKNAEHNTFQRMHIFAGAYAKLTPPFVKEDATSMTDAVHCAFVDDTRAEAAPKERTLINTTADLSKPEISVRWYLGDVGPIEGTNHMEDRMSEYYTFGFSN